VNRAILLHYHEINLKGGNRGWFEMKLHRHVERLLADLPHGGVRKLGGRMLIPLLPDSPVEELRARLSRVFGIANLSVAWDVPADLEQIRAALGELLAGRTFSSFRIDARRGTKDFPLNSQRINEELGGFVQGMTGAAVRLENPELTCSVEMVSGHAFLSFEKVRAGGGLPTGTGGKVVCLLSGGIDSPVAAYRLMRRGCQVVLVHFHSFPHTTVESQDKVRRIAAILARFQLEARLHLVPFGEVQREIVAYAPPGLRVLLYRRFMLRIAGAIAAREKAAALVTGDNLGQVASQTLENLRAVSSVASLPIFRPLIGDDKEEIMNTARAIGTYDISILADQDCCTMFVPRHPETMGRIEQMEQAETALDIPRLVESALRNTARESILPDFLQGRAAASHALPERQPL
jgi:tRNA uracil 4-sulfurtransferase